ncbi:beta-ketoacyl synthase chain length factor [Sulfurimonas sp. HSL3-7]|uniref:beta-ketoacyl synthase chain length factor n=1 Tax=Sulfonitrofixus jiaomeiensis TaxID=3131938 RepID=UPI0031F9937D
MIRAMAKVAANESCDNLDEKRIVPKMMLRRRLTRSARIMVYLADACGFSEGSVVYGSAYGEMQATADIVGAIDANEPISPTAFQNSVYNTAPSYFSLLHGNKEEILTVSSGDDTSANVLQTGALQAVIKGKEVLLVCSEAINIPNIDEVNTCTDYLESGVALTLLPTEQEANIEVVKKAHADYAPSLWAMLDVFDACDGKNGCIVTLEL